MGDYSNVGFVYKELVKQLPITTQELYVYPLKKASLLKQVKDGSVCRFSSNVVGINVLSKYIKELCKAAGVLDWRNKTPHMMRAFVCTTLANDSSVNQNEVARALRHKSIQSQQAYIGMTAQSEMARNNAILGKDVVDDMVTKKTVGEDRKLTAEEKASLTDTKTSADALSTATKAAAPVPDTTVAATAPVAPVAPSFLHPNASHYSYFPPPAHNPYGFCRRRRPSAHRADGVRGDV